MAVGGLSDTLADASLAASVRVDPAQPPLEACWAHDWLRLARVRLQNGNWATAAAASRVASRLDPSLESDAEEVLRAAQEGSLCYLELPNVGHLVLEVDHESLETSRDLTGGVVWRGGELLASWLPRLLPDWFGIRVLEIGSGTGVLGLGAALLGADVLLTDLPEAVPLLQRNVARNLTTVLSRHGKIAAHALDWREHSPALMGRELVLACECVWRKDQCEPLARWLSTCGTPCLFLYTPRGRVQEMRAALLSAWSSSGLEAWPLDIEVAKSEVSLLLPSGFVMPTAEDSSGFATLLRNLPR
eukprot:gnl/TRDRNA2_/TRDRNA2_198450_c0_seq1.p1 gnl/TRDRNA2_/TRDRNA2_198450_c0~~gnl/TRDRNA2_/TRDRNA2_198450_c0_seq1.p1  ORF type:complete len:302 (+),score=40.78 gnl/TRDRNA2_/TRDRNA2_198450_c0_seq1:52-957(+)